MTTLYKTKYLEFKSAKSPSGSDWNYVKRTNDTNSHDSAVVITTIVKMNDEYKFLFLKTRRPPIYGENKAQFCLESPAGLIADENTNETLLECANKELLEETGYTADKMYVELVNSSTSAGLSSETISYVTAIINNNEIISKPISDGGIITERFFVPVNEIYEFLTKIDTCQISVSSATVCGLFFALKRKPVNV